MAATILTITDLAAKLDTDPRTTRKFLRSITPIDAQPGKGSRWGIPAKQVQSLKAKFKKFEDEAKADKVPTQAEKDALDGIDPADFDEAPTALEARDADYDEVGI